MQDSQEKAPSTDEVQGTEEAGGSQGRSGRIRKTSPPTGIFFKWSCLSVTSDSN